MKSLLLLLLFIPILGFSQYTAIPDENFEQALIELGYDKVIDGKVLTENIDTIDTLKIAYQYISDLTGIEAFTALTYLNCVDNELTSLDLSQNTALTQLFCGGNNLTSLDISGCTDLTELHCNNNQLTSLDVSKNTALKNLHCDDNNLKSLDVRKNTALHTLDCSYNQIKSLDVSGCTDLTELRCGCNNFDCKGNDQEKWIHCFMMRIYKHREAICYDYKKACDLGYEQGCEKYYKKCK